MKRLIIFSFTLHHKDLMNINSFADDLLTKVAPHRFLSFEKPKRNWLLLNINLWVFDKKKKAALLTV